MDLSMDGTLSNGVGLIGFCPYRGSRIKEIHQDARAFFLISVILYRVVEKTYLSSTVNAEILIGSVEFSRVSKGFSFTENQLNSTLRKLKNAGLITYEKFKKLDMYLVKIC
jgi:hypothetical protein